MAVARADEPDSLAAALDAGPAIVQVHGPIPAGYLAELRARGLGVIQALAHDDPGFVDYDDRPVDALLVDGSTPGSGRPHSFFALLSRPFLRPVAAAGGLTPETVGAVVERFDVWGVDVATGVESSPGVKDPARVAEFVRAARAAHVAREEQRELRRWARPTRAATSGASAGGSCPRPWCRRARSSRRPSRTRGPTRRSSRSSTRRSRASRAARPRVTRARPAVGVASG